MHVHIYINVVTLYKKNISQVKNNVITYVGTLWSPLIGEPHTPTFHTSEVSTNQTLLDPLPFKGHKSVK